jgi:hypothetical protein
MGTLQASYRPSDMLLGAHTQLTKWYLSFTDYCVQLLNVQVVRISLGSSHLLVIT